MSSDDTLHPQIPHRPAEHYHYVDLRRMTLFGVVAPDYLKVGLHTEKWTSRELHETLEALGWKTPREDGFPLAVGVYALVPTELVELFEAHYIARGEAHRVGVWKLPPPDPRWASKRSAR
ncbi:hypothetical protein [Galbitalea soli]|uniref:Uncharacterized protein n=1 Tax=Galbitalea soli TaxID=1268042 RepID=A0A7C9PP61_9MICO|nr:hypothetical protein [Galbitalea soli]NEM91966.1 hypothetical protein [Galbitalea soli]NYJ32085.1 hypothetical protein [Galbitalea soli]